MRVPASLACLAAFAAAPLTAQVASAYVPLSHWAMPHVEHLIARGVVADPAPLTRPLRQTDLVHALEAADTTGLSPAERRVVRRIVTALARPASGPSGRVDAHLSASAASYANRDALRPVGQGHATVAGGLAVQLLLGPVAAVTHPYFDTRLKYDPEYFGKKDRAIAGRNAEAYLSGQWRYGELFFGALDRNWGAASLEGLLLSPAPYSYAHFGIALGTSRLRLEGVLTQLDDTADTAGATVHRYLVTHRLIVRPSAVTTLALWEGSLLAGTDRALEPWFANILTLGLVAQYDEGTSANSLLGVDVHSRIGRVRVFGSVLIDDIQVDDDTPGDAEPSSYGLTLGAQAALAGVAWTALYTRVSNLAYRTPSAAETWMRRNVGMARNYSDYDQLSIRGSLLVGPGLLLAPEATLLRQGEGDFRLPFPPVSAYDTTPTFLVGNPERTLRLALAAQLDAGPLTVSGNGGVHVIRDAGHVRGRDETKWVGSLTVMYRLRFEGRIP
ncbi:MAG: hypothetical protein ACREMR_00435 [Gemmatimonadales bacterium]